MAENGLNAVEQIEVALQMIGVRMPWRPKMTSQRRYAILSAIVEHLETAGPAGFASMCYFGMIRRRRPGGLTIRRAANVHNILKAIDGSELELEEFRVGLDELTLERIRDAGDVWHDHMNRFWASESARMKAERLAK